jgi:hypothetical protein
MIGKETGDNQLITVSSFGESFLKQRNLVEEAFRFVGYRPQESLVSF